MAISREIQKLVADTPFVDTHEHLHDESLRVKGLKAGVFSGLAAPDFGMLFGHYADSDLQVAGMKSEDYAKLIGYDLAPKDKWKLLEPYYERARHTGYLRNVRESVRMLYDEDDVREDNCEAMSKKLKDLIQPGYYEHVLRKVANIEYCQVNYLAEGGPVFKLTENPALLMQDISTVPLSTGLDVKKVSRIANREAATLKDWHEIIDWCFSTYGPKAIATKNQCAYGRRLDFALVPA